MKNKKVIIEGPIQIDSEQFKIIVELLQNAAGAYRSGREKAKKKETVAYWKDLASEKQ